MSDLDQLFADTFERRAAVAPVGLSPEAVRRAIHRQHVRTAKGGAGAIAATLAVSAGIASAVSQPHRLAGETATATHTPSTTQLPGTVLATIPWDGGTQLSVRYNENSDSSYDTCITQGSSGFACFGPTTVTGSAIDSVQTGQAVYGTAPWGTSRLVVTVAGHTPVAARLAPLDFDQPGLPVDSKPGVLFGVPGLDTSLDKGDLLKRTVSFQAFDSSGARLATYTAIGSWDLAQAHPPASPVASLPALSAGGGMPTRVWVAKGGWVCTGVQATVGGAAQLGADSCSRPVAGVASVVFSFSSAKTFVAILRVPANTATAEVRTPAGTVVNGTLTRSPYGTIAVVVEDGDRPTDPAVLTCRDAAGTVVFQGALATLRPTPDAPVVQSS